VTLVNAFDLFITMSIETIHPFQSDCRSLVHIFLSSPSGPVSSGKSMAFDSPCLYEPMNSWKRQEVGTITYGVILSFATWKEDG
jgi:hypothetical protein